MAEVKVGDQVRLMVHGNTIMDVIGGVTNTATMCGENIPGGTLGIVKEVDQYPEDGYPIRVDFGDVGGVNWVHNGAFALLGSPETSFDPVERPAHYNQGKFEVIDVIEDWGLDKNYFLGNVIKYVARSSHKGNEAEDLKKARFYLNRYIDSLES